MKNKIIQLLAITALCFSSVSATQMAPLMQRNKSKKKSKLTPYKQREAFRELLASKEFAQRIVAGLGSEGAFADMPDVLKNHMVEGLLKSLSDEDIVAVTRLKNFRKIDKVKLEQLIIKYCVAQLKPKAQDFLDEFNAIEKGIDGQGWADGFKDMLFGRLPDVVLGGLTEASYDDAEVVKKMKHNNSSWWAWGLSMLVKPIDLAIGSVSSLVSYVAGTKTKCNLIGDMIIDADVDLFKGFSITALLAGLGAAIYTALPMLASIAAAVGGVVMVGVFAFCSLVSIAMYYIAGAFGFNPFWSMVIAGLAFVFSLYIAKVYFEKMHPERARMVRNELYNSNLLFGCFFAISGLAIASAAIARSMYYGGSEITKVYTVAGIGAIATLVGVAIAYGYYISHRLPPTSWKNWIRFGETKPFISKNKIVGITTLACACVLIAVFKGSEAKSQLKKFFKPPSAINRRARANSVPPIRSFREFERSYSGAGDLQNRGWLG